MSCASPDLDKACSVCLHRARLQSPIAQFAFYVGASYTTRSVLVADSWNMQMDFNARMSQQFRSQSQSNGGRGRQRQDDSDAFMRLVSYTFPACGFYIVAILNLLPA